MADIHMICGIEGCEESWDLKPSAMKKTLDEHRRVAHPGWVPPQTKPMMDAYRLDYSRRGRQL